MALIDNPDRRRSNPNLLYNGKQLAIYDHDLAFSFDLSILPFKKPWEEGASGHISLQDHVLFDIVRKSKLDLKRLRDSFKSINNNRLQEYGQALPDEWIEEGVAVQAILRYIMELVDNVDEAIKKLIGALS